MFIEKSFKRSKRECEQELIYDSLILVNSKRVRGHRHRQRLKKPLAHCQ